MATKMAMASNNDNNDNHNNNNNRDNNDDQDNNDNKDNNKDDNADNNNKGNYDNDDNEDNSDDNEDKDGVAAVVGGFVGVGSICGGNCGGVGGGSIGRWWVVAVVGLAVADSVEVLAVALEGRRLVAARGGPSWGQGGHVEEYFCVV